MVRLVPASYQDVGSVFYSPIESAGLSRQKMISNKAGEMFPVTAYDVLPPVALTDTRMTGSESFPVHMRQQVSYGDPVNRALGLGRYAENDIQLIDTGSETYQNYLANKQQQEDLLRQIKENPVDYGEDYSRAAAGIGKNFGWGEVRLSDITDNPKLFAELSNVNPSLAGYVKTLPPEKRANTVLVTNQPKQLYELGKEGLTLRPGTAKNKGHFMYAPVSQDYLFGQESGKRKLREFNPENIYGDLGQSSGYLGGGQYVTDPITGEKVSPRMRIQERIDRVPASSAEAVMSSLDATALENARFQAQNINEFMQDFGATLQQSPASRLRGLGNELTREEARRIGGPSSTSPAFSKSTMASFPGLTDPYGWQSPGGMSRAVDEEGVLLGLPESSTWTGSPRDALGYRRVEYGGAGQLALDNPKQRETGYYTGFGIQDPDTGVIRQYDDAPFIGGAEQFFERRIPEGVRPLNIVQEAQQTSSALGKVPTKELSPTEIAQYQRAQNILKDYEAQDLPRLERTLLAPGSQMTAGEYEDLGQVRRAAAGQRIGIPVENRLDYGDAGIAPAANIWTNIYGSLTPEQAAKLESSGFEPYRRSSKTNIVVPGESSIQRQSQRLPNLEVELAPTARAVEEGVFHIPRVIVNPKAKPQYQVSIEDNRVYIPGNESRVLAQGQVDPEFITPSTTLPETLLPSEYGQSWVRPGKESMYVQPSREAGSGAVVLDYGGQKDAIDLLNRELARQENVSDISQGIPIKATSTSRISVDVPSIQGISIPSETALPRVVVSGPEGTRRQALSNVYQVMQEQVAPAYADLTDPERIRYGRKLAPSPFEVQFNEEAPIPAGRIPQEVGGTIDKIFDTSQPVPSPEDYGISMRYEQKPLVPISTEDIQTLGEWDKAATDAAVKVGGKYYGVGGGATADVMDAKALQENISRLEGEREALFGLGYGRRSPETQALTSRLKQLGREYDELTQGNIGILPLEESVGTQNPSSINRDIIKLQQQDPAAAQILRDELATARRTAQELYDVESQIESRIGEITSKELRQSVPSSPLTALPSNVEEKFKSVYLPPETTKITPREPTLYSPQQQVIPEKTRTLTEQEPAKVFEQEFDVTQEDQPIKERKIEVETDAPVRNPSLTRVAKQQIYESPMKAGNWFQKNPRKALALGGLGLLGLGLNQQAAREKELLESIRNNNQNVYSVY